MAAASVTRAISNVSTRLSGGPGMLDTLASLVCVFRVEKPLKVFDTYHLRRTNNLAVGFYGIQRSANGCLVCLVSH